MQRFAPLYIIPTLLVMLLAAAPLVTGSGTLYTRDVLTSHYPLKVAQAESLARGELPLIDPYRAGGQPLVGNPNALPLYPTNLLYLVASPLWAMNAHFWLHWLLAPLGFYAFGRVWGLGRAASWVGGVCYAASGFFLSLMNLYNLVAGAALAPAFLAAFLAALGPRPRRYSIPAAGVLWGLLLLAGDPFFAALTLLLALTAALARHPPPLLFSRGQESRPVLRLALALGLGTLLALPMLAEFVRILPLSFRGYWRYSIEAALSQSWDPRTWVEWFLPFFFGQPDFSFWGQSFYGGNPPLLYSLFPGVLCWALVLTSGRPKTALQIWPWLATLGGLFCALGAWNPVMHLLYRLPGASSLRYPVKFWLAVAIGASLLCALGFERLLRPGGLRRMALALAGLGTLFLSTWLALITQAEALRAFLVPRAPGTLAQIFEWQHLKWSGLCLLLLANLTLLGMALYLMRRHPRAGGALLLMVHLGMQCFFLAPLYDADEVESYVTPPTLLSAIPADARVVHGAFSKLFGTISGSVLELFEDPRFFWLSRSHFQQLHPFAGVSWGLTYDFNHSPEGLDSFYVIALSRAMQGMPDFHRLAVLRASGVDILLLHRPLSGEAQAFARLVATYPATGHDLYVYEIVEPAESLQLVGTIHRASNMDAALERIGQPDFDPRREAILPGEGEGQQGPPGSVELLDEGLEHLEVRVDSEAGGVLTTRRAFLGIYRATLNGEEVQPRVVNVHRLGVEVPPGSHQVRIWADRRFFHLGLAGAFLGLLGLLWLLRPGKPPREQTT